MAIINVFLGYREFSKVEQIKARIKKSFSISPDEDIDNAEFVILFETSRQKTWLIVTEERMICVLDDVQEEDFVIKWSIEKEALTKNNQFILELKIDSSYRSKTGLIDFGPNHKNWLYSKKLYPTESNLKTKIQQLISGKMLTTNSYSVAQY